MGQTAKTVRTKNGRIRVRAPAIRLWACCTLATLCGLFLFGRAPHAEEKVQDPRIAVADRRGIFRGATAHLEDLFATGMPIEEGLEYIRRLQELTMLLASSLSEPSARIDLLQRKLQRVRARMGGAVEVVGNDGRTAYSALEYRLRREEASLLREIDTLRKGGSND